MRTGWRPGCRRARARLQEAHDQAGRPGADPQTRRHLESCPDCRRFAAFLAGLGPGLQAALDPAAAAGPGARRRGPRAPVAAAALLAVLLAGGLGLGFGLRPRAAGGSAAEGHRGRWRRGGGAAAPRRRRIRRGGAAGRGSRSGCWACRPPRPRRSPRWGSGWRRPPPGGSEGGRPGRPKKNPAEGAGFFFAWREGQTLVVRKRGRVICPIWSSISSILSMWASSSSRISSRISRVAKSFTSPASLIASL